MKFAICVNEEMVRNRAGIEEDQLNGYTSADLVNRGVEAAEKKLAELCGFDIYMNLVYDGNFRNWNGGKYYKQGKYCTWQSCGELLACDINSPSMKEIAYEAHLAYDKAIEEMTSECLVD